MQQPIFVDTVTEIPADFMNLVAQIVFGPLNQATTVQGVLAALNIGTLAAQNANAVAITGGTLDGVTIGGTLQATGKFSTLFVSGTPTDPHHAANKAYVDSQVSGSGLNPNYVALNYLALSGGALTGPLTLAANPTLALQAATKQYVDTVAAGFVTQATLNEALGAVPSSNYVNALIAQQAARELYHDSFTMNGSSNLLTLRATPAGDVIVFVNGIPVPANKVSLGAANTAVLTYNPIGAVEAIYYGKTGTGTAVSGLLPLSGGTMTGPIYLAADPTSPFEAATKEYVDTHGGGGGTATSTFIVSGAPSSSLGTAGSVAIDPTAGNIYGPKTTTWPAAQTINAALSPSAVTTLNTAVLAAQTAAGNAATAATQAQTTATQAQGYVTQAQTAAGTASGASTQAQGYASAALAAQIAAQNAAASVKLTTTLSTSLTLAASSTAVASGLLGSTATGLIVLMVESKVTTGSVQNYTLALYDGDPNAGGVPIYQSTGITVTDYRDTAMFFQPTLTTGNLYAQISNIDADAITATVSVIFMSAST